MKSSLRRINGGISFKRFCDIINDRDAGSGNRKGLRDIYDSRKKIKGHVTSGDASLIASTIMAQSLDFEW